MKAGRNVFTAPLVFVGFVVFVVPAPLLRGTFGLRLAASFGGQRSTNQFLAIVDID